MKSTFPLGKAILLSSVYSTAILATALGMIAYVSLGATPVVWMAMVAILLPASMLVGTLLAINFHFLGHEPGQNEFATRHVLPAQRETVQAP